MLKSALVFFAGVCALQAQPEVALRQALNQLQAAENYSWEKKVSIEGRNGLPLPPFRVAAGKTIVGGFTHASFLAVQVLSRGNEMAFGLKHGWRHVDDLTDDDIAALQKARVFSRGSRTLAHALPHEVLVLLRPALRNARKERDALVADVDPMVLTPEALQLYLSSGAIPRGVMPILGSRPVSERGATVSVEAQSGLLIGFSIEIWRRPIETDAAGRRVYPGDPVHSVRFDLSEIGTTKVDVPPEGGALFLESVRSR